MKKLLIAAAFGAAGLMSSATHAATTTDTFDVIINLTAACEVVTLPDITLNYVSFQPGNATATTDASIRCTQNLGYTLSLDQTSVTDAILNLDYTLAFTTGGNTGNGGGLTPNAHTIQATMTSGQAGTCAALPPATCGNGGIGANRTRTLTVTF